jgi:hypothetical protein
MRRARRSSIHLAAAMVFAATVVGPLPARATWSDTNCRGTASTMTSWKRSQARSFVAPVALEGYEWDGGCYKLNDRDDTPGVPDSGGEGNDCSGLVFRAWALREDGQAGFRMYPLTMNMHGPYTTAHYYSPSSSAQYKTIGKSYLVTVYMDALVYRANGAGHIGLIYTEGANGVDTIIEAKGDAEGSVIAQRDYRSSSAYRGVARKVWTPECFPRCT